MRLRDRLFFSDCTRWASRIACLSGWVLAMAFGGVEAQTVVAKVPAMASQPGPISDQTWLSLSKTERVALAPLEKSWDLLGEGHKRKWLAIAKTYPTLGAAEQEKMHSRMAEWAALSPKDREVARLNFAQSKAITKSDRAANWEAYQALSPEEREKLARGSKVKPVGAAVSVRPVASDKLTPVPVTRHTPEAERSAAVSLTPINRSTLLPKKPAVAAGASAPAPLATPSNP